MHGTYLLTIIAFAASLFARARHFISRRREEAARVVNPLVERLRREIEEATRNPHAYGNRHTRRAMDSRYFRHRSRRLPLLHPTRRAMRRPLRASLEQLLKRRAAYRRMLAAKALRRAFNFEAKKERRSIARRSERIRLLRAALDAIEPLIKFGGTANVVMGPTGEVTRVDDSNNISVAFVTQPAL